MTDIEQLQEERLRATAQSSGVFRHLICFLAARREFDSLEQLARDLPRDHPDRLTLDLVLLDNHRRNVGPLLKRFDDQADSWMFYTLAKYALRHDRLSDAIAIARQNFLREPLDVTVLNLVIRYLLHAGDKASAAPLIERSLRIAPRQWDIKHLAQPDTPPPQGLYLSSLPQYLNVSFYIPAFNVERFMRPAIEGLLDQDYPIHKILIVNDGCTDATIDLARKYPVIVIDHETNRGLAAARNTAFQHTDSPLLGAIDTDAIPDIDYTRNILMELENTFPQAAGVGGRMIEAHQQHPPDLWRSRYLSQDPGLRRECADDMLFGCNTIFHRDKVINAGGYDEKYRTNAEDRCISERLVAAGHSLVFTPRAIVRHQRNDTVASVLRTRWSYFFWHMSESGQYESPRKIIELFHAILNVAAERIRDDLAAGHTELLYIHACMAIHNPFMDVNHAVETAIFTPEEGRRLQKEILATLKRIDERFGGRLFEKVYSDVAHLLLPSEPASGQINGEYREEFQAFLDGLLTFRGAMNERTYALISAPASPPHLAESNRDTATK